MSLVLGFAELLQDIDVVNTINLSFVFDPPHKSTETIKGDAHFLFEGFEEFGGSQFKKYRCKFIKKGHKTILLGGAYYQEYEFPLEFSAYKRVDSTTIFFQSKTHDVSSYIKIINKIHKSDVFRLYTIDILETARRVHNVAGAWFSLPAARITSKSIHGDDLLNSTEFIELCQTGSITSLNITYSYKGATALLIISGRNSIFFQGKFEPKKEEYLIIFQVFSLLVLNVTR